MKNRRFILAFLLITITQTTFAQSNAQKKDWLIDGSSYKAEVKVDKTKKELVLTNGLLRRTFRTSPNCATIGFENLATGNSIIRGVKPEARVTIDGVQYDVGGLTGQPNYAFLKEEWIDALKNYPHSFQYRGYEIGNPKKRFDWKKVRNHSNSSEWPPKGVSLRLDFVMPTASARASDESNVGREKLHETVFDGEVTIPDAWKVSASKSNERNSFINEGKAGEIYCLKNTYVYAERALPKGVKLVEMQFDPGTDLAASWGPAIAIVWKNKQISKFNMCTGGYDVKNIACFGGYDSSAGEFIRLLPDDKKEIDTSKPWTMRLRIDDEWLYCEAKIKGGRWHTYKTLTVTKDRGAPRAVRIGKLGRSGGAEEGPRAKDEGLSRVSIKRFAAYGPFKQEPQQGKEEPGEITVSVHYELYDGIPAYSKWLTVKNTTNKKVVLNRFTSEILAAVEHSSHVEAPGITQPRPNIHAETDYAFGGFTPLGSTRYSVHWLPDPQYSSQVNYRRGTPCLLEIKPTVGPAQDIVPGKQFESFRAFVLPHDSYDRERKGLSLRRMYRIVAPWITENPLMMHVRWSDWKSVKKAIDQCSEVGFEMVILTFGSGFNIENESPGYIAEMKKFADYAKSKGIEIGGYSLLSSRRIGGGNDVVSPPGEKPAFGNAPALTSRWGQDYFRKLYEFYPKTGMALLEHDGSYPGDRDITARLPLQKGADDSRWAQWKIITDYYKWCRANGIYLNVPDYYYLSGSNKCGMGYREVNWSLPRAQQVIHTRQNIFDGSWQKTPSMGWMFVPLTQYQGGGAAATIEPLDEHLGHYRAMMISNLGLGVQACYRGPRIYDTDRTKAMVKQTVDWFKTYRDILESDLVHGRRADGRSVDWMLHVNPKLKHKGLLMAFNPAKKPVKKTIRVNLYYTGLGQTANIRREEGKAKDYKISRDYTVNLELDIPAEDFSWYVIE